MAILIFLAGGAGNDSLRFTNAASGLNDLLITQVNDDAVIDYGAGTVALFGVQTQDLVASDFLFGPV